MSHERDLDRLAGIAYELSEKVRDDDPNVVLAELTKLWSKHPVKAAQLTMCLAIWFDPDITVNELWERVNSVARSRVLGRTA